MSVDSDERRPTTQRTKYLDRAETGQIYFRANGKRARLPDDESSPEFAAAYDRLVAAHKANGLRTVPQKSPGRGNRKPVNGRAPTTVASIGWFIERYLASDYFIGRDGREPKFSAGTRFCYRPYLEAIRRKLGAAKLADLTPQNVDRYLAKVAREHSPAVASVHKILLSNLWKFARGFDEFERGGKTNPMKDVGGLYQVEKEHEPWPQDVQDRFLAACDENLYFAFHLLLCTGQRISDVIKMKWDDFNGTHFRIRQKKTRTEMWIKAPRVLLDLLECRERVHECVLTHRWRRPYTRDSLGHSIKNVLIEIGAAERGTKDNPIKGLSVHGLRKNAGIMLAENGATVPQIMAALGHTTPKLALYYCRLANQKTLNDQAVAIMDDVFERRAAERRKATRAKLRVVD